MKAVMQLPSVLTGLGPAIGRKPALNVAFVYRLKCPRAGERHCAAAARDLRFLAQGDDMASIETLLEFGANPRRGREAEVAARDDGPRVPRGASAARACVSLRPRIHLFG
jgi:hypothetical protein